MKRIANLLTGLSLAVLFFSASAYAQNDGQKLIADVPFEFTVGRVALPPGHYAFVHTSSYIFQVIAANGHSWLTTTSAAIQENRLPEKSRLTFATVGGRHVLVQIWNGRVFSGSEFPNRHAAVEAAKTAAIPGQVSDRR